MNVVFSSSDNSGSEEVLAFKGVDATENVSVLLVLWLNMQAIKLVCFFFQFIFIIKLTCMTFTCVASLCASPV